ncbi:MAG: glycoside hydrolase family 32 protein [Cyclobacteriaceae bacterium]|jgi:fructan beta-fructosidase|nr:glycoside hydrolase family 32 protein [Cyclobacteriaceae bacterium]
MKVCLVLLSSLLLLGACAPQKNEEVITAYEAFRPQFHFTPKTAWMNDPNGLVFYEGEYHLFYQHYPDSTVWGPMHWGHAVSTDLIHWEHLPIALYPDSLGYIFSGSAVVDWKNTSGLGSTEQPPLVAIFTYHNAAGERAGKIDYQTQGIAYSLDKGRTWTKYDHNPVLANPGIIDFRDPKVAWNEVSNQWVMTLAVKDHIEFYGSPDLKKWNKLSEFGKSLGAHGGVWECPDLFPLKDEAGNTHWVLFVSINPGGPQGGSATQYFVGDYDGKNFIPQDTLTRWIDYGADNYAGVTWSDIPAMDGRRLFIGWMSNWQYANVVPTKAWRSATTLPREVVLNKKDQIFELKFKPAAEIKSIVQNPKSFTGDATMESPLSLIEFNVDDSQNFILTISNDKSEKVIISAADGLFSVDRTTSGITNFSDVFPAINKMDIRDVQIRNIKLYLDLASIEIFINDGERVMTEIVFPETPYTNVKLQSSSSQFMISSISSIWK